MEEKGNISVHSKARFFPGETASIQALRLFRSREPGIPLPKSSTLLLSPQTLHK